MGKRTLKDLMGGFVNETKSSFAKEKKRQEERTVQSPKKSGGQWKGKTDNQKKYDDFFRNKIFTEQEKAVVDKRRNETDTYIKKFEDMGKPLSQAEINNLYRKEDRDIFETFQAKPIRDPSTEINKNSDISYGDTMAENVIVKSPKTMQEANHNVDIAWNNYAKAKEFNRPVDEQTNAYNVWKEQKKIRKEVQAEENRQKKSQGIEEKSGLALVASAVAKGYAANKRNVKVYQNALKGKAGIDADVSNEEAINNMSKFLEENQYYTEGWLNDKIDLIFSQAGQQIESLYSPEAQIAGTVGVLKGIKGGGAGALTKGLSALNAGRSVRMGEAEAGAVYEEMLQAGADPDEALIIASGVGVANTAIEAIQFKEIGKGFGKLAGKKVLGETGKSIAKKSASDMIGEAGKTVLKEGMQEAAQEAISMSGVSLAAKMNDKENPYTKEDWKERITESFEAGGFLGMIGAGAGLAGDIRVNTKSDIKSGINDSIKKPENQIKKEYKAETFKIKDKEREKEVKKNYSIQETENGDMLIIDKRDSENPKGVVYAYNPETKVYTKKSDVKRLKKEIADKVENNASIEISKDSGEIRFTVLKGNKAEIKNVYYNPQTKEMVRKRIRNVDVINKKREAQLKQLIGAKPDVEINPNHYEIRPSGIMVDKRTGEVIEDEKQIKLIKDKMENNPYNWGILNGEVIDTRTGEVITDEKEIKRIKKILDDNKERIKEKKAEGNRVKAEVKKKENGETKRRGYVAEINEKALLENEAMQDEEEKKTVKIIDNRNLAKIKVNEKEKKNLQDLKDAMSNDKRKFKRKVGHMVSSLYEIEQDAKKTKDNRLLYAAEHAKGHRSKTNATVGSVNVGLNGKRIYKGAQTNVKGDIVGKSLAEIFDRYVNTQDKGYTKQAFNYLYRLHDIDRQREEKAVFQDAIPKTKLDKMIMDSSREQRKSAQLETDIKIIKRLEKEHPEFKQLSKDIDHFMENMREYMVDTGLITKETAEVWKKKYPHYVPTHRAIDLDNKMLDTLFHGRTNVEEEAVGSNLALNPLDTNITKAVKRIYKQGELNLFFNELLKRASEDPEFGRRNIKILEMYTKDEIKVSPKELLETVGHSKDKNAYTATTEKGTMYAFRVSDDINRAIEQIDGREYPLNDTLAFKAIEKASATVRELQTNLDIGFVERNLVKDFDEALMNTENTKEFLKNYKRAFKEISKNSKIYQEFMNSGVMDASLYAIYNEDISKNYNGKIKNAMGKIKEANTIIEMLPRFAEYMTVRERTGDTYLGRLEAAYKAKDITTNFGRSGKAIAWMNSHGFNYLNASVQGFSKMYRKITDGTKKQRVAYILKAAAYGIAPMVANSLMYGDDEDYEILTERDKTRYFLIKYGDGMFIKIPKGRAKTAVSVLYNDMKRISEGEKVDLKESLNTIVEQVGINNPFTQNMLSPIIDASQNRTWYGGKIDNDYDLAEHGDDERGERYDTSTDAFSKYIGKALNISPKRVNYVLDSYSGVLGNFILPIFTDAPSQNILKQNFTYDSVMHNRLATDYYETRDKLKRKADKGDESAKYAYRYIGEQTYAINKLQRKIRKIEESDISNKEKYRKVRETTAVINGIRKNALEQLPLIERRTKHFKGTDEDGDIDRKAYADMDRELFGADYALKKYDKYTAIKYTAANMAGIDSDVYYDYYFKVKNFDAKDSHGNSIRGLKKKRTINYINSLKLNKAQKFILLGQNNYRSGYAKNTIIEYLDSQGVSEKDKKKILKGCGYEV